MSILNKKVPEFKVEAFHDYEFVTITNENIKDKWALFMFYPADFTFVCPTELQDLAHYYEKFQEMGVEVYSVSTDTHFTHFAWHDSSPAIKTVKFPMLADPTGALCRAFDVYIEETGAAERGTFLVDPDGVIKVAELTDGSIGRSAAEMLRKVQAAQYVRENQGQACPSSWKPGEDTLAPGIDLVGKI